MCCHIDLHTHAGSEIDNPATLTFDLLTSGLMHVEGLSWSICLYRLSVDSSDRFSFITRTDSHACKISDATDCHSAGVGN